MDSLLPFLSFRAYGPRKLMKITWRQDRNGLGRRGRPYIGEFEAVFLSDPERA